MVWIIVGIFLFLFDQGIKLYIEKKWNENETRMVLKEKAVLSKFHNKGTAFSRLTKHPGLVRLFSLGALAVFLGVFFPEYFKKRNGILKAGLTFLIAGGSSNVFDRIFRGYVVDYISFPVKKCEKLRTTVFNAADFFIFAGCIITAIESIKKGR